MTIYTAHELRTIADSLRGQIDGLMTQVLGINELAGMLEKAADGAFCERELQAAVDAINAGTPTAEELGNRMDAAFDRDDPVAWAQAASELLLQLPPDQVVIWMEALNAGLLAHVAREMSALEKMPVAGSC